MPFALVTEEGQNYEHARQEPLLDNNIRGGTKGLLRKVLPSKYLYSPAPSGETVYQTATDLRAYENG